MCVCIPYLPQTDSKWEIYDQCETLYTFPLVICDRLRYTRALRVSHICPLQKSTIIEIRTRKISGARYVRDSRGVSMTTQMTSYYFYTTVRLLYKIKYIVRLSRCTMKQCFDVVYWTTLSRGQIVTSTCGCFIASNRYSLGFRPTRKSFTYQGRIENSECHLLCSRFFRHSYRLPPPFY